MKEAIKAQFAEGNYSMSLIASRLSIPRSTVRSVIERCPKLTATYKRHRDKEAEQVAKRHKQIAEMAAQRGIRPTAEVFKCSPGLVQHCVYEQRNGSQMMASAKEAENKAGYYVPRFWY
jgi:predicted DNA-binding protein YlxM (UPF0122 family)